LNAVSAVYQTDAAYASGVRVGEIAELPVDNFAFCPLRWEGDSP